jgi:hypothetical protein
MNRTYIIFIATVCHQAKQEYEQKHCDFSTEDWCDISIPEQTDVIKQVEYLIENPNTSLESLHNNWLVPKLFDNWTYADTKDLDNKTHPHIVMYDELSFADKHIYSMFVNICRSLLMAVPS